MTPNPAFSTLVAYNNQVACLQRMCDTTNRNLKFNYVGLFNTYMINVLAGRPATEPTIPNKYVVIGALDESTTPKLSEAKDSDLTDSMYKMDVEQVGSPVCDRPNFQPPTPAPNVWFHIG